MGIDLFTLLQECGRNSRISSRVRHMPQHLNMWEALPYGGWVVPQTTMRTTTQPVRCPRQHWSEDASRLVACHRVMRSKLAHVFFKFNSHCFPSLSLSLRSFLPPRFSALSLYLPYGSIHMSHTWGTRCTHACESITPCYLLMSSACHAPHRPLLHGCGTSLRCKANAAHTQRSFVVIEPALATSRAKAATLLACFGLKTTKSR